MQGYLKFERLSSFMIDQSRARVAKYKRVGLRISVPEELEELRVDEEAQQLLQSVTCGICQKWPRVLTSNMHYGSAAPVEVCKGCGVYMSAGNELIQLVRSITCFPRNIWTVLNTKEQYTLSILSCLLISYFKLSCDEMSYNNKWDVVENFTEIQ